MTPVSRNLAANLAGKICVGLLTVVMVPVYVRLMGMESYGLVGLFTTFQTVLLVLDLGLSTTLNRELARRSMQSGPGAAAESRDLVRTLELPYWMLAALLLAAAWPLGSAAAHWVQPGRIPDETLRKAMILMGLALGLQFPFSLYSGGLMGLQRQVLLNVVIVSTALVRFLGAALVLWKVNPGIDTFLQWQLLSSALQTAVAGICLWSCLPASDSPARFRRPLLAAHGRFAGGVVSISVLAIILMQADKLLLSRLLPLEEYGYYTLASVGAAALSVVVGPLYAAVFPRFSQLLVSGESEPVRQLYHKSSQTMAVLVLPAAAVLVLFSRDVMFLWSGNAETAERTHRVIALLAAGTALNGLMNIPYALQLAHGWTRLAFGVNLVSIFVLIPALVVLTQRWGAPGAAAVWLLLNTGYIMVTMPLMHRRLLRGELGRWYAADVALPLVAAVAASGLVRYLTRGTEGVSGKAAAIAGAGLLAVAAAALVAGHVRRAALGLLKGAAA